MLATRGLCRSGFRSRGQTLASRKVWTATSALEQWPLAQVTSLNNGIRVASERTHSETATVGVFINTGTRYETAETNGVAHFLEHLLFKGTPKRTREQLETEVENIGGHLNAYTSRESTVFYAKVFKNDVAHGLEILSDILLNSRLAADDVERERAVILREQQEVLSQPEEVIFDDLHATAFQNCSLGRNILGSDDNIKSITPQMLRDYISQNYTGDRIVICGAGAVDHAELVKNTELLFSKIQFQPARPVVKEPAIFTGSDIRSRYDSLELAHIAYGFPTGGWNDPDTFPLMVIQTMLGNWDEALAGGRLSSSPLVRAVSSNRLARSISAFNTQYSDTGLFGLYAVAEPHAVRDLSYHMTEEITRFSYHVEEGHLAEAKAMLKMNILAMLDGSTAICEDLGRHMLQYGRRIHPLEILGRIDAVDKGAIHAAAKRFLFDTDFALAAHGPTLELPDYNWFRRRTFWMRYSA